MNQPNPLWAKLLEKLPPAQHAMVTPILEEWDANTTQKFQEIHAQYEPLKAFQQFVDNNIQPDFAWQSVQFADELQRNPQGIIDQINDNWELGNVTKDAYEKALASQTPLNTDDDLFTDDENKVDLSKVPEFVAMQQALQGMQDKAEQDRQAQEQQSSLDDFEIEIAALEEATTEANKPFNKTLVTAFMSAGLSGEDAVKEFHKQLGLMAEAPAETTATTDAPVTMGNGGTVGGGQSDGTIDWNSMSTGDFNDNVAKALEAQMGINT